MQSCTLIFLGIHISAKGHDLTPPYTILSIIVKCNFKKKEFKRAAISSLYLPTHEIKCIAQLNTCTKNLRANVAAWP